MLARLALGNVRRTLRDYTVYAVTLVVGVAVFYAFNTITVQARLLNTSANSRTLETLMSLQDVLRYVTVALACVMGFLMMYANTFLVRRRARELALYQVLGMRPGQVARILSLETLVVGGVALAAGLTLGMLLSQLMVFVTASLFETRVMSFRFFLSTDALALTLACFALMFLVMMATDALVLRRVRIADLLGVARRGERRVLGLPASVALFAAGVALVAWAYARLRRDGIPGFGESLQEGHGPFVLTCVLVTAGTVALFFGLSGTATGTLSRLRSWWQGLRAFTVRQLAARVGTASASMAAVALVLFLAVTALSLGVALVQLDNEQVRASTPFDASVVGVGYDFNAQGSPVPDLAAAMRRVGVDPAELGSYAQVNLRYATLPKDGSTPNLTSLTYDAFAEASGHGLGDEHEGLADATVYDAVSLADYNAARHLRGMDPVSIGDDQYLLLMGDVYLGLKPTLDEALSRGHEVSVAGVALSPARAETVHDGSQNLVDGDGREIAILVVPDVVAERLAVSEPVLDINYTGDAETASARLEAAEKDGTLANEMDCAVSVWTKRSLLEDGVGNRGVVTYLAVYVGLVLVVACAAILAIQQLSAASDAAGGYRTLAELGCPQRLMRRSVRAQVAWGFALPLVVGLAHAACAIGVVTRTYDDMMPGFSIDAGTWVAVGVFVCAYGAYLALTCHAAWGVVRGGLRAGRRGL